MMQRLQLKTLGLLVLGLGLLIAVIVVGATVTLRQDRAQAKSVADNGASANPAGTALSVAIIHPEANFWPDMVIANGEIAAWQEAMVTAEFSGASLVQVLVDVGEPVKQGQLLARFDDAQARSALAQQQATLKDAEARLAEAISNATQAQRLKDKLSISEQDLIRANTARRSADAQVELARARLTSQLLLLEKANVLAPDDGTISSRNAMLGMVATPGLELFRLIRQGRLEWRAELTASDLGRASIGSSAEIELPDGHQVRGTVRQIGPILSANTRTGVVYVSLDDGADKARIGMFAGGTIVVSERMSISLPETSLVQRDGHEFLFLVDTATSQVNKRKVRTGRRLRNRIEIREGVEVSDAVVESGGAFLNDGDHVRIVDTLLRSTAGRSR